MGEVVKGTESSTTTLVIVLILAAAAWYWLKKRTDIGWDAAVRALDRF